MEAEWTASQTNLTLINRLRQDPNDQTAWGEFVGRCGPWIYAWCRQWALQDADAQDVTQEVLFRLFRKVGGFAFDPARNFSGWLRTLTQHACCDFLAARRSAATGTGDLTILDTVAAREDREARLKSEFDLELLHKALAQVQLRLQPQTWHLFRLTALEGESADFAARQLGVCVTAVYRTKNRVQGLIRQEIARLEED